MSDEPKRAEIWQHKRDSADRVEINLIAGLFSEHGIPVVVYRPWPALGSHIAMHLTMFLDTYERAPL
jgi:hypothetical protein